MSSTTTASAGSAFDLSRKDKKTSEGGLAVTVIEC
jgi:hypothetical protein